MNFAGIGKIGSFVKQKNLLFAANYKIKTGQSIVDSSGRLTLTKSTMFSQVKISKTNSTSTTDKARLASIKQKLKSGKKLSAAEMNYLKEKDPSTYKKAKYADEAREELKSELRTAETKQEARQAVMRATAKIAAQASADFEALKAGGGDINFGGGINFDADMNFDGAGTENISADFQNFGGEISSVANSENLENVSNENSFAQNNFSEVNEKNSDDAFEILDKYIIAIRAIQDEWINFTKSDEYKELPEDILEKIEKPLHGEKNFIDAIFAYKKSINYRLEL